MSTDPIESDVNLYRYCENNPLIYTDPSGQFKDDFPHDPNDPSRHVPGWKPSDGPGPGDGGPFVILWEYWRQQEQIRRSRLTPKQRCLEDAWNDYQELWTTAQTVELFCIANPTPCGLISCEIAYQAAMVPIEIKYRMTARGATK